MTSVTAKLRQLHVVLTTRREQRKRRIADLYRRAAIRTFSDMEIGFVKATQAGENLDCLAAKVRALTRIPRALPMTARHFRNSGVDITADQLADQIIASMQAVASASSARNEDRAGDKGSGEERFSNV